MSIASVQRGQPVDAGLLHQLARRPRRAAARRACGRASPTGDAVGLHADRVDHGVRAAPVGQLAHRLARRRRRSRRSSDLDAVLAARSSRSGTRSMPITCRRRGACAIRHAIVADRAEPEHDDAAAVGHRRVLDGLPRRRQHVGQVHEAVVGRSVGHLDRAVLGLRHPQVLGLPAGHLAVELGVAEQRRARALLVDLRRLALRLQALVAHVAVTAGDVERDHDAVADGLRLRDLGADLLDDAHRLVAEDVALVHERPSTSYRWRSEPQMPST